MTLKINTNIDLRKLPEKWVQSLGCPPESENYQCKEARLKKLERVFYDRKQDDQLALLHKHHQPSHDFLEACIANLDTSRFIQAIRYQHITVEHWIKELNDRLHGWDDEKKYPLAKKALDATEHDIRKAVKVMLMALIRNDADVIKLHANSADYATENILYERYEGVTALLSSDERLELFPKHLAQKFDDELKPTGIQVSAKAPTSASVEDIVATATYSTYLKLPEVLSIYKSAMQYSIGHAFMQCAAASIASGDNVRIEFVRKHEKKSSHYDYHHNVIVVSGAEVEVFGIQRIFVHELGHYCGNVLFKNKALYVPNFDTIKAKVALTHKAYDAYVDLGYIMVSDIFLKQDEQLYSITKSGIDYFLAFNTAIKTVLTNVANQYLDIAPASFEHVYNFDTISHLLHTHAWLGVFSMLHQDMINGECDDEPLSAAETYLWLSCAHNATASESCAALPDQASPGQVRAAFMQTVESVPQPVQYILARTAYILERCNDDHEGIVSCDEHAETEFVAILSELDGSYGTEAGYNFFNAHVLPVISHDLFAAYRNATCENSEIPKISELLVGYTCSDQD